MQAIYVAASSVSTVESSIVTKLPVSIDTPFAWPMAVFSPHITARQVEWVPSALVTAPPSPWYTPEPPVYNPGAQPSDIPTPVVSVPPLTSVPSSIHRPTWEETRLGQSVKQGKVIGLVFACIAGFAFLLALVGTLYLKLRRNRVKNEGLVGSDVEMAEAPDNAHHPYSPSPGSIHNPPTVPRAAL